MQREANYRPGLRNIRAPRGKSLENQHQANAQLSHYRIITLKIVKNIDDLMQQKYDNDDPNGRFAFREEYWEQALALIEADEARRRKKRRWLLWWCLAGMLLVAAGYGFWGEFSNTIEAKAAGQVEKSIVAAPDQENKQEAKAQRAKNNAASEKGQEANAQMASNTTGNKKGQGANLQEASNNTENKKGKGLRGKTIKNNGTQKTKNTSQLSVDPLPIGQQAGKTEAAPNDLNTRKAPANSSISQYPLSASNAASTSTDPNNPLMPGQPLPNSNTGIPAQSQSDNALAQDQTLKSLFAPIYALPLPMDTVSSNRTSTGKKPSAVTAPPVKQIKPIRDSRYTLGFAAATAAYQPAPDKRWLGFSGGFFGSYKLSESWSASIGLGLRYQPGHWLDTAGNLQTESLRYSFGFESLKTQRRALGLLSLEIPIAAAWHRGAFAAEAGIAPGRLLVALERYEETSESSLNALKTTLNRLERGETNIYHQYYANAFAGLEWKFIQNASINLRGNYRFGAILKAALEDPSIKGGSNLELGLKWTFGI